MRGVKKMIWNIQTCDGGKHKRKDRPNGGMYITRGDISNTVSTVHPSETYVVTVSNA